MLISEAIISRMPLPCVVVLAQRSSTCPVSNCIDSASELFSCCVQAALTDNPPVYILGGNIIPLGQPGMMTTSLLRASNLTLLAAFASPDAPAFERCGQGCSAQSSPGRLVTCGHMYLDHGGPSAESTCWDYCLDFLFSCHGVVKHATQVPHGCPSGITDIVIAFMPHTVCKLDIYNNVENLPLLQVKSLTLA